jgi:large conductance mechanosensitive channel protein
MKTMLKNFMDFVRTQGVVGLAVGLAIGAKAGEAVSSLVDNFINPLVKIILQGTDLNGIHSTVAVGKTTATFGWGLILNALIALLATGFVVYFIVDKAGLTKLDKK